MAWHSADSRTSPRANAVMGPLYPPGCFRWHLARLGRFRGAPTCAILSPREGTTLPWAQRGEDGPGAEGGTERGAGDGGHRRPWLLPGRHQRHAASGRPRGLHRRPQRDRRLRPHLRRGDPGRGFAGRYRAIFWATLPCRTRTTLWTSFGRSSRRSTCKSRPKPTSSGSQPSSATSGTTSRSTSS